MFVTNWISPTKIQKISEITNFFRHYFLSRTEVIEIIERVILNKWSDIFFPCIFSLFIWNAIYIFYRKAK